MSIFYPIEKPVSADDFRNKLDEMLGRPDEWTAWQTVVLQTARENADAVHGHYMRRAWFETGDGTERPDMGAARDGVMEAAETLMDLMVPAHGAETVDGELQDRDPVDAAHGMLSSLLVHAAMLVDDVMTGLRRGDCAIVNEHAYDLPLSTWAGALEMGEPEAVTPAAARALKALSHPLDDGGAALVTAQNARSKRSAMQGPRNMERVQRAAEAVSDGYGLKGPWRISVATATTFDVDMQNEISNLRFNWGVPTETAPDGTPEILTRPFGSAVIPFSRTVTGELHPQTLSEVVRVGYLAALTIGRDAEIRSAGHRLGDVPAWCRAGPATVIAIVCGMLRDGIEVDLNTGTVTERGPMLSVADHDVGQGAATYTFDGVTFDESVWMAEQLSHDLVHDCIGNPMRRLMAAFPDDDAVIQSCEHEGVGTGFDLVSPIVRLAPAPVGYEQDPVQAWLSLAADFDEAQVYGPRLYGPATKEDQD